MIAAVVALEYAAVLATVVAALSMWSRAVPGAGAGPVLVEAAGLSACILAALHFADLYRPRALSSLRRMLRRLPRAFGASVLLTAGFALLVPGARPALHPVASGLLLSIGVLFGPLLPLRLAISAALRRRRHRTRLLLVGTNGVARRVLEEIERHPDWDLDATVAEEGVPLEPVIDRVRPDRIAVTLPDRRGRLPAQELLAARMARGIPVSDSFDLYERVTGRLPIDVLPSTHLIFAEGFRRSGPAEACRRAVHVLLAGAGLLAAAPLMLVIALTIWLDSGSPVLFRQRRLGLHGRAFVLLKFRTMVADDAPVSEWECDNRHRLTRVGRWLRRWWLDELPQLVNILRGEMDLVGPRAHPVSNAVLFRERIPYYALRTAVRPGLAGWAQVRFGYANNVEEEAEKMRYDLYYIKHRSLWFDLRILLDTLKMALDGRPRGASDEVPVLPAAAALPGQGAGGPAVSAEVPASTSAP